MRTSLPTRAVATRAQFVNLERPIESSESQVVFLTGLYTALWYLSDGSGGAQGAKNCETLRAFRVRIAPAGHKRTPVDAFVSQRQVVERTQQRAAADFDRIRENHSMLISATVTGPLDISTFQANLPELA